MPRKALPIHVDTMPTIQINRFVIPMADFAASINVGIACHATPRHTSRFGIGRDQPLIPNRTDSRRVLRGHHNRRTTSPHQLLTDMRLASTAAAERLIPVDHGVFVADTALRNEKPLTLPDRFAAFDLLWPKTRNCSPHIVDAIAGHCSSKPVALIPPKQELVSGVSVPNHQNKMAGRGLHVENLGCNGFSTSNIEEFASTVPANINSDLQPRPNAEFLTRTRAPIREKCRRKNSSVVIQLLQIVRLGYQLDADEEDRKRAVLCRADSMAIG